MQMARHHNLPGRPGVSAMISHRARSGVIATCLAFLLAGTGLAQVPDTHLSIEPRTRAEAARIATVTKPATDFTAPAPSRPIRAARARSAVALIRRPSACRRRT